MKKTIKINECEFHRIISESVKRVLNEVYDFSGRHSIDANSDEFKKIYDDFAAMDRDESETEKEIADYEAMPERFRHPVYDYEKRRLNRSARSSWGDNPEYMYGDKLAQKTPNNILSIQNEKRKNKKKENTPINADNPLLRAYYMWLIQEEGFDAAGKMYDFAITRPYYLTVHDFPDKFIDFYKENHPDFSHE